MAFVFSLNGRETTVPMGLAKSLTLNEYIRNYTSFKGTKLSCGQGGCGACTVNISRVLPDGTASATPAASCLMPLLHVAGASVVTAEGLKSSGGDLHPIQSRLAGLNGTQCGFCTPGMVMSMYSALSQLDGGKNCTTEQLSGMDVLAGNLCRCTGYRPLEETLLSFASDTKIVDPIAKLPVGAYEAKKDPEFPAFLNRKPPALAPWLPTSMDELMKVWGDIKGRDHQLVMGHTGWGVFGDPLNALEDVDQNPGVSTSRNVPVLHLRGVPELHTITESGASLTIGAGVTLARLIQTLSSKPAMAGVRDHLHLIAGHQVRSVGSVGGNIMMSRNLGFASDAAPVLASIDTTVSALFADSDSPRTLALFDFLQTREPCLLLSLTIPLAGQEGRTRHFRSCRAALRSRNAYSLANAAFCLEAGQDNVIVKANAIFGALGDRAPFRSARLEEFLRGKTLASLIEHAPAMTDAVLAEAEQWLPEGESHRAYRLRQVQTFTFKLAATLAGGLEGHNCLHRVGVRQSQHVFTFTEVKESKEKKDKEEGHDHCYKGITKTSAGLQTTGEAQFVDDNIVLPGSAFAALVPIPEACMTFDSLDDSKARDILGAQYVGMVSYVDVEKRGLPTIIDWTEGLVVAIPKEMYPDVNEAVFLKPGTKARWAGEPVALVLGTSQRAANRAAKLIQIVGATPSRDSIRVDVLKAPAFPGMKPTVCSAGKAPKTEQIIRQHEEKGGLVITASYSKSSQHHMYMEPQTTHCIPTEDGGLLVWNSTQALQTTHAQIARGTGISQNKVVVRTKRVGGGFGGKIYRQVPPAVRCALAAKFFNMPVRLAMDRALDLQNTGGRPELGGTFKVAVDREGKMLALQMNLKMNCGALLGSGNTVDCLMGQTLDQCYELGQALVTIEHVQMNTPPCTPVRSPGHQEGTALIEAVMDVISTTLRLPPERVRAVNLVSDGFMKQVGLKGPIGVPGQLHDNPMGTLWPSIIEKSQMAKRRTACDEYNKTHRWTKRGLSISPGKYLLVRPSGMPARVDVFQDGSIQVATSGSEIGQGLHTKVAQVTATVLSKGLGVHIPISKIAFTDFSTDIIAAQQMAGGSTTSELACMAAEAACNKLLEKFAHAKKELLDKQKKATAQHPLGPHETYTWDNLVKLAHKKKEGLEGFLSFIDLGEKAYALPQLPELMYTCYGAAVAEVEVDVLTGESRVLSVFLMMDSGPVLNPSIDLGQVEGAFVMGMGQNMLEGVFFNRDTGKMISDNTWNYKIPGVHDIPQEFSVHMVDFAGSRASNGWTGTMAFAGAIVPMPYKPHNDSIKVYNRSSRAMGEPPLLMASSIHSAIRQAVSAARSPMDGTCDPHANYDLPAPATPEVICELCWQGGPLSAKIKATGTGQVEHTGVQAPPARSRAKTAVAAKKDTQTPKAADKGSEAKEAKSDATPGKEPQAKESTSAAAAPKTEAAPAATETSPTPAPAATAATPAPAAAAATPAPAAAAATPAPAAAVADPAAA